MSEQTISVTIPSDLYTELGSVPSYNGKLMRRLLLDLAVGMFVSGEISLARAAAFASMPIADFAELLNNYGVPVVDYTEDMLADDLTFATNLKV